MLYRKLSVSGIKKNLNIYFPYIVTYGFFILMLNINLLLLHSEDLKQFYGVTQINVILKISNSIISIFALLFLYYSNKFIYKNRIRELSLYGILGLDKKALIKILFWEDVIVFILSVVIGLIFSTSLYKLVGMIFLKLMNQGGNFILGFSLNAYIKTILVFLGINFFIFIIKMFRISRLNLLTLLNTKKVSEIKAKGVILKSVIAIVTLSVGYLMALFIKNPIKAGNYFVIAVILVILGTYSLFGALSILILKILKKNKNLYYKTKNFTAISGIMFRIKQNAAGLASICIMSCAALVLLSCAFSLNFGIDANVENAFERQFSVYIKKDKDTYKNLEEFLQRENIKKENIKSEKLSVLMGVIKNGNLEIKKLEDQKDYTNIFIVYLFEDPSLKEIELFKENNIDIKNIVYKGEKVSYKKIDRIEDSKFLNLSTLPTILLRVNNLEKFIETTDDLQRYEYFDLEDGAKEKLIEEMNNNPSKYLNLQEKERTRESYKVLYGGIFFVGIFLSLVFIVGCLLIIYYKQLQEGYEDIEKFEILRRVGMTEKEILETINTQVKIFFMLPIIVSGIHMAVAYPMISRLLMLGGFMNEAIKIKSFVIVFLVFALIYYAYYKITSKIYYKTISNKLL